MTTAIAILDDYQNVALEMADWSVLPADVAITVFDDHEADVTRLAERLADFDVVAIMRERTPFPRELIERLAHLRLLVTTGGRNASIDLAAAAEHGVTVCGTGAGAGATAELTWGLILSLLRRIHDNQAVLRAGGWQDHIGLDLAGKTLGILGLGRLGAQVARVGVAFGMEVQAWSQNLDDARAAASGARRVELEALLAAADVVTIHLVLSERTRRYSSDPDRIEAMPSPGPAHDPRPIEPDSARASLSCPGSISSSSTRVSRCSSGPATRASTARTGSVNRSSELG